MRARVEWTQLTNPFGGGGKAAKPKEETSEQKRDRVLQTLRNAGKNRHGGK